MDKIKVVVELDSGNFLYCKLSLDTGDIYVINGCWHGTICQNNILIIDAMYSKDIASYSNIYLLDDQSLQNWNDLLYNFDKTQHQLLDETLINKPKYRRIPHIG